MLHCAAIPKPTQDVAHAVFANNLLAMFNVVEACVRSGVTAGEPVVRDVPGMIFAERPFEPAYFPIDEAHPIRPQDPYALAKHFGEQLCDAAVQRSELRCITIRPTWVQDSLSYERNLGPMLARRFRRSARADGGTAGPTSTPTTWRWRCGWRWSRHCPATS